MGFGGQRAMGFGLPPDNAASEQRPNPSLTGRGIDRPRFLFPHLSGVCQEKNTLFRVFLLRKSLKLIQIVLEQTGFVLDKRSQEFYPSPKFCEKSGTSRLRAFLESRQ